MTVAARTYTNQGAGPTESNAADRVVVDLTSYNTARLFGHVSTGGATASWKAQFSTNASAWTDLTNTFSASGTGLKSSAPLALPAQSKTTVIARLVATGGNATEDPVLNAVVLEIT